jgi:hypothetical protein
VGHVNTTFFQQDGACPHVLNVILDIPHDVFCSRVLLNQFPEHFGHGWSWPLCSLDINLCNYFLWGYHKDRVYRTILHTVQELQAETEAIAEEITDDMLHDTVDNFVVCLQQVHEVEGSHIEHVFT